jgi:hypothetical protein
MTMREMKLSETYNNTLKEEGKGLSPMRQAGLLQKLYRTSLTSQVIKKD